MARGYEKPGIAPTKTPSAIDIAWSAGIYEGEGTICDVKKGCTRATVAQKDPEILFKLRDWFGGSVLRHTGKASKPEQVCYKWCAYGDRGRVFIALIYSFLSSRRRAQVDSTTVLDFLEERPIESLSMNQLQEIASGYTQKNLSQKPRAVQSRLQGWAKGRASRLSQSHHVQERVM